MKPRRIACANCGRINSAHQTGGLCVDCQPTTCTCLDPDPEPNGGCARCHRLVVR